MRNIKNFKWGWMETSELGEFHKKQIEGEIFTQGAYERFFKVNKGDVVLDVGASTGPFTYSILDKEPSRVICIEPSDKEYDLLEENTQSDSSEVIIVKKAIGPDDSKITTKEIFGSNGTSVEVPSISFPTFIKEYNIDYINFLKTDCEGGEYNIFNEENIEWIKKNVDVIVGEWHLKVQDGDLREKFREFRERYLKSFPNFKIYSLDGVDITWDIWNEHFIKYYNQVIIYIDNR